MANQTTTTTLLVRKRDGTLQKLDPYKIIDTIQLLAPNCDAFVGTPQKCTPLLLQQRIQQALEQQQEPQKQQQEQQQQQQQEEHQQQQPPSNGVIDTERLQDAIEKVLVELEQAAIATRYAEYRQQRQSERAITAMLLALLDDRRLSPPTVTPWGPLGYITYKRTYSRTHHVLSRGGAWVSGGSGNTGGGGGGGGSGVKSVVGGSGTVCGSGGNVCGGNGAGSEEFADTIVRVLSSCQTQLHCNFTSDELQRAFRYMMQLKFSVAGRFLWQLGTTTVHRLGLASLQNCAFVKIDHPVRPFTWIFDMLMLGAGVGFNVQRHNVEKLPPVMDRTVEELRVIRRDTHDADFIVPDTREGWVKLFKKLLKSYFVTGKGFSYSTVLVRPAGTPIRGFGGVASGPDDLCRGMDQIQRVLQRRRGERLTSVDCLDVVDIVASIVVAGNIRRSACMALGDYDDLEYLNAKRWDLGNVPNWRAFSNNSVVCDDVTLLPSTFWEGYEGRGEPYGLVNLSLARRVGRLQDGERYADPDVEGVNPCSEQTLSNYETCCLSEIFLPNVESFDEFKEVTTLAYRICKHSLMLPCHHPQTQDAVRRHMRMGIGITGYMQCTELQRSWLSPLYDYLRAFDETYSRALGVNPSVKLTTVKPSGTLSLLTGTTPGAHPGIYPFFIRRLRMASTNPLTELCRSHGYPSEYQKNFDGTDDTSTVVVSFPCRYPSHTIFAKDMTAVDQLEVIKRLQHQWSDNAVSVTVYYRREELPLIKEWLAKHYTTSLKGCSFLLHSDHGFQQAPYEEITEQQYYRMLAGVKPITSGTIQLEEDYSTECAKGLCPVK